MRPGLGASAEGRQLAREIEIRFPLSCGQDMARVCGLARPIPTQKKEEV
jgi:hypothetical protein